MKAAAEHELAWSPRRWLLALLLVTLAQFGLVFWLSTYPAPAKSGSKLRTHVRLLPVLSPESQTFPAPPDRPDPTLFALGSAEGFSGTAWLALPQFSYRPAHPPEPIHWLPLSAEDLGEDFAEFVQTNLSSEDLVADRLPPALAQPQLPTPVIVSATLLKVEGDLAARRWFGRLPQTTEQILTNTVVRVLVDKTGAPVTAALLSSSGAVKADQDALNFARTVRFAAGTDAPGQAGKGESRLTSGDLIFQWTRLKWDQSSATTAQR